MSSSSENTMPPLWQRAGFWFSIALLLRVLYLFEQGASSVLFYQPLLDEQEMAETARAILGGDGFGAAPLFKAPFYPSFLALVMAVTGGGWYWGARLIQHLCGALLVAIAYDSARHLSGDRTRGRLFGVAAAALMTFYAPLIRLENRLILDFFAVFFQSAMLWALIRMKGSLGLKGSAKWAAAAGAFAMLAWLNRPTITPVLPLIAIWIAGWRIVKPQLKTRLSRRRFACAGIFLLFPAAAMLALMARNVAVSGEALAMPWQGGFNFYHANAEGMHGKYLEQGQFSQSASGNPTRQIAEQRFLAAVERGEVPAPAENEKYAAINGYWYNLAWSDVKQDPSRWLGLMLQKALYLLSAREIYNFEAYEIHKEMSVILRRLPLNFGMLFPFALASLFALPRISKSRRSLFGLLWLYAVALGGAISLFYVSGRLRMPLVFPAALLASAGIVYGVEYARRFKWSMPALSAAALLIFGIILSWGDWWGVRSESQRYLDYARLSNAAWRDGQPHKALEFVTKAEDENPDYPTLPLLKGQALYSLGRVDEARPAFLESLERLPRDSVAAFNLGIIDYYHNENPDAALEYFQMARRRQPDYHKAIWMEARCLCAVGQYSEAGLLLENYRVLPSNNFPRELMLSVIVCQVAQGHSEQATDSIEDMKNRFGDAGLDTLAREMQILNLETSFKTAHTPES